MFDLNIKVFGNGWNIPQHLGFLDFGEDNLLFNNAKICVNISEEHSYIIPDFIERLFKVPASGGFLISDKVFGLEEIFLKDQIPTFNNYEEFVELIQFFLKHDDHRWYLSEQQYKHIIKNHTYYHRINKILNALNLQDEANKILEKYVNV